MILKWMVIFIWLLQLTAGVDLYYNFAIDGAQTVNNRNAGDGEPKIKNR